MKLFQISCAFGLLGHVLSTSIVDQVDQLVDQEIRALWGRFDIDPETIEAARNMLRFIPKEMATEFLGIHEWESNRNDESFDQTHNLQKLHQPATFKEADFESVSIAEYDDNYGMRIKKHNVEDLKLDTVKQYSGYFDVRDTDKHFFYWFFESRNDPKNDPLVIWLNGGPGCALDTGLLFELGPSLINSTGGINYNPFSWNANASVIFLDQPVGTGLSYGNDTVDTTEKAAKDFYVFLELFFRKFPEFKNNKFHISGESYAGHYIPAFAAEIISHPERSFDIETVLIGNGYVDAMLQSSFDQEMLCSGESVDPILDEEECEVMNNTLHYCLVGQYLCLTTRAPLFCGSATYFCSIAYGSFPEKGLNPYDLRMNCTGSSLCYDELDAIDNYLNSDYVKSVLGVPHELVFELCKSSIGEAFANSNDGLKPFISSVAKVLDYGIPVLFYAGDKDFVCHWIGYNQVSNYVKYKHHEEYLKTDFEPWFSNGKEAGKVRGFGNFTFLRVYDSGHMVPHDQPEVSLNMLNSWLNGDYLFEN